MTVDAGDSSLLPQPDATKRVPQLDGVRGVAILLVLVWHYFVCQIVATPKSLTWYCQRATSLSWTGVDLFFVLSGFLSVGILLDHRDASNYFGVFYVRRVCRILPLYLLVFGTYVLFLQTPVATSSAFAWLFQYPIPVWSYATFTQNIFMGLRGTFGPEWLAATWSLAVEEQFYLFIPLLVFFLPRRTLLPTFVICALVAALLRYTFPGFHAFVNAPFRADSLLSGGALAVVVRWKPFLAAVHKHRSAVLSLFMTLLAGAAVMTKRSAEVFGGSFSHLWLAGLYCVFVLIAFAELTPVLVFPLRSRVLVWFGQLSYGIYMFHQVVSGVLYALVRRSAPEIRTLFDATLTVAALCITLICAWVSYRFFELPILRFGHRFSYRSGG